MDAEKGRSCTIDFQGRGRYSALGRLCPGRVGSWSSLLLRTLPEQLSVRPRRPRYTGLESFLGITPGCVVERDQLLEVSKHHDPFASAVSLLWSIASILWGLAVLAAQFRPADDSYR